MSLFSKQIDKRIAAYQRELIETHYWEVENMYGQIRGWRHDYRNHIQTMKAFAANGDLDAIPILFGPTGHRFEYRGSLRQNWQCHGRCHPEQ